MHHSSQKNQDFSQHTTEMLRVVLSSMHKPASLGKKLVQIFWLAGAALVVLTYLILPLLILLHQVFNIVIDVLLAANIFLAIELIISCVLLKIAQPTRTSSSLPQPYQPDENYYSAAFPIIKPLLSIPTTPIPASSAPSLFRLTPARTLQQHDTVTVSER
jgi:hypothetical protein